MKSKKLLRAVAVLMSVAMLATGCGTKKVDEKSNNNSTSEKKVDGDGRQMEGNLYLTGLPIVKEKEKFSILIDSTTDPNTMELFKDFEKKTNVKIDWLAYPSDIATEKKGFNVLKW